MVQMSTSNKTEQEYILGHSIAVNDLLSTWQIFVERCSSNVVLRHQMLHYSSLMKGTSPSDWEPSLKDMSLMIVTSWMPDGLWSRERPSLWYNKVNKHCQKRNGPEGWVLISSSKTNLDQISSQESRPSISFKINTKILTKCRFRITTKIQLHNLYKTSATKYWPNSRLESCLNFNFKSLTKPCAQSLNKSLALFWKAPGKHQI